MIWDFHDGMKYESVYSVNDYDYNTPEEVVQSIKSKIQYVKVLLGDPVSEYERMHRQAAVELEGTDRAKSAFLESALRRIEKMGKGILLSVSQGEYQFRLIVTRHSVSILKPVGTKDETPAEIADQISEVLEGVAHKLVC